MASVQTLARNHQLSLLTTEYDSLHPYACDLHTDSLHPQRLAYYDTDQSAHSIQLTSTSIFSAIEGVSNGHIRPKHSENVLERFARVRMSLTLFHLY